MKYLIALLSIFYLSSTVAFANCIAPNLDNNFLTPYETENQKWHVSAPYYYDDPDLGLGIKFKTSDITVDFYTFDFGIENFTTGMTDQLLQQSVSEMLQVLNYPKTMPTSDPLLLPQSLFEGSDKYLVHNAVYVIQENKPSNFVSIVSVGFDGKCFQKLRFTKELNSRDIDIKSYFDNPTYEPEIAASLYMFAGFVRILNEEFYRISYYK